MEGTSRHLDRFGLLLAVVTAAIITSSVIDVSASLTGSLVVHTFNGAALMLAVRASGVRRVWRRVTGALVLGILAVNVLLIVLSQAGPIPVEPVASGAYLWLMAAFAVPVVVARRVAAHEQVTTQTVLGAIAAYLQIAVAYAAAYQALDHSGAPVFGTATSSTTYTYFSLTTISTLGYGDVTASTDLARMVAVSEAVVGQVYLVVFVAFIVARFASRPAEGERMG